MATATRPMTADEFLTLPDEPGMRQELVRGEVRTMSLPGGVHGRVAMKLGRRIGDHVEANDLGETFAAETGFLISRDPDTVRGADVAYLRRELADRITETHIPFPPDLAVEVASPNDRPGEIAARTDEWLGAGSRMVWNLDPQTRTATIHRPGMEPLILGPEDQLDGLDVLPGFRCRVGDLLP